MNELTITVTQEHWDEGRRRVAARYNDVNFIRSQNCAVAVALEDAIGRKLNGSLLDDYEGCQYHHISLNNHAYSVTPELQQLILAFDGGLPFPGEVTAVCTLVQ